MTRQSSIQSLFTLTGTIILLLTLLPGNGCSNVLGNVPRNVLVLSDATVKTIKYGSVQEVFELLTMEENALYSVAEDGTPCSHIAVKHSCLEVVMLFVNRFTINSRDQWQRTPLNVAVEYNRSDVALWLLDVGAEAGATDACSMTPFQVAAEHNLREVSALFPWQFMHLTPTATYKNPIVDMAMKRPAECVAMLVEADAHARASDTPSLHTIAKYNLCQVARVFLGRGVNININVAYDGKTPLQVAVERNLLEMAQILLEHGASLNVRDADNKTPLHVATNCDNQSMVQLLLEHNMATGDSASGMIYPSVATRPDWFTVTLPALKPYMPINAKDEHGMTILHIATKRKWIGMLELILGYGPAVDTKDDCGATPLQIATELGWSEGINMLLEHGAARQRRS